jgi:hypothetical protein
LKQIQHFLGSVSTGFAGLDVAKLADFGDLLRVRSFVDEDREPPLRRKVCESSVDGDRLVPVSFRCCAGLLAEVDDVLRFGEVRRVGRGGNEAMMATWLMEVAER